MTSVIKTTIKTYFETGDKPTSSQFSDFIDSCAFLAETTVQTFVGNIGVSGAFNGYGGGTLNNFTLNNPTVSAAIFNSPTLNTPTVSAGTFSSPTLTGVPVAPTAAVGTNTTQVATMAAIASAKGKILQIVEAMTGSALTSNNIIPADNTTPQFTEGLTAVSANITPKDSGSTLKIEYFATIGAAASAYVAAALFKDGGANALTAAIGTVNAFQAQTIMGTYLVSSVNTNARAFQMNFGASVSGASINSWPGMSLFNGIMRSGIRITEIS